MVNSGDVESIFNFAEKAGAEEDDGLGGLTAGLRTGL
jgi:hypothetical protein